LWQEHGNTQLGKQPGVLAAGSSCSLGAVAPVGRRGGKLPARSREGAFNERRVRGSKGLKNRKRTRQQ